MVQLFFGFMNYVHRYISNAIIYGVKIYINTCRPLRIIICVFQVLFRSDILLAQCVKANSALLNRSEEECFVVRNNKLQQYKTNSIGK